VRYGRKQCAATMRDPYIATCVTKNGRYSWFTVTERRGPASPRECLLSPSAEDPACQLVRIVPPLLKERRSPCWEDAGRRSGVPHFAVLISIVLDGPRDDDPLSWILQEALRVSATATTVVGHGAAAAVDGIRQQGDAVVARCAGGLVSVVPARRSDDAGRQEQGRLGETSWSARERRGIVRQTPSPQRGLSRRLHGVASQRRQTTGTNGHPWRSRSRRRRGRDWMERKIPGRGGVHSLCGAWSEGAFGGAVALPCPTPRPAPRLVCLFVCARFAPPALPSKFGGRSDRAGPLLARRQQQQQQQQPAASASASSATASVGGDG
jgi:hypothetical protein